MSVAVTARRFSSLVRLEHSLFALPYAYVGAILAVAGWPGWKAMISITVAMVGARSLAMALNRLIDAQIDAANPRTANRELPRGLLSRGQVIVFGLVSLGILLLAVSQLAPITRWLWPIPVAMFVIYPYLKRVTPFCHLWLGATIGLAPVGAWVAVTDQVQWEPFLIGAVVACWIAGFDVIYATMDIEHDRAHNLHSLPADYGLRVALLTTRFLHGLAVVAMIGIGLTLELGVVYWLATVICAVLLAYENAIVKPDDLSRVNAAFFNVNAILAGVYLAGVAIDAAIS